MPSHNQPGTDNVLWLTPADYAGQRFVRPIAPARMARAMGEPVSLYDGLEERARIARVEADVRRDLRVMRWQRFIKWASIAIALGIVAYFAGQFAR